MIEIYPNLFVGPLGMLPPNQRYLAACKEPSHRDALGYTTKAAPKSSPEYLWCYRKCNLILNLIDGPDHRFISKEMIEEALNFLDDLSKPTYLFCMEGRSRSPSIALMWLVSRKHLQAVTFEDAEAKFIKIYSQYKPNSGIRMFAKNYLYRN